MLFKFDSRQTVRGFILIGSLILASCSNSAALEGFVSADSRLKEKEVEQLSNTTQLESPTSTIEDREGIPATSQSTEDTIADEDDDAAVPDEKAIAREDRGDRELVTAQSDLPFDFPVYPQAQLERIKSEENSSGMLTWQTSDNRKAVADYYQAELLANDWDIIKPFSISPEQKIATAIATKDDLRLDLTLLANNDPESDRQNTELSVIYHSLGRDIANDTQTIETAESREPSQPQSVDDDLQQDRPKAEPDRPKTTTSIVPNNDGYPSDTDFTDLDDIPEQLQQPLKATAALGVLTPYTGEANVELSKFAPNEIITRGEYARWLIAANNRYYSDNPGKKIYIASKTEQPAFKDVKPNHPDFAAIQSLAEAGLIPSRLTKDSTNLMFRPDAPLTREDLITWKVPLDTRQSLPQASIEAIEESWGFQDAANTDSSAVRALYADFQNGDFSNVRRIFGYTTLFQPKKPVTRAEAATSLWYFGFQGDGITAQEILESEAESDS